MIIGKYPNLRLRRSRKHSWSRRLIQENSLSANDFILPIFLVDGKNTIKKINSMPDVYRYSIDKLGIIVDKAIKNKIPMVALFPYTNNKKKDKFGREALNEENLVCKGITYIKKKYKNEIGIMCDVALDPYTSHGHDGLLKSGYVLNDETIEILIKQSLLQAQMGCDVIAPSDMMDGRIGKIRKVLDKNGHHMVQIISYAVKYASSFYGPFRDAVGSIKSLKSDKKNYQMDFSNSEEAFREVALDIKEGADMVLVKPGLPYLDIIRQTKDNFKIPVIAYQVSGEYSLIKNGIKKKIIGEDSILESLMSFKRAGASAIVTYFALQAANKIKKIN
jgi:porphobilinogen synthase